MDNQLFYLIPPEQLDFRSNGIPLQQRREMLSQLLEAHGALWATIRSRGADFMKSVEELDRFLGTDEELMDCAFENSPGEVLPIGSCNDYAPLFGYYDPDQVTEFNSKLHEIPDDRIEEWEGRPEPEGEIMSQVVQAFRSTFAEAATRRCAVAIDHS